VPLGFPAQFLQENPILAVSSRPMLFVSRHSALSNKTGTVECSKKATASFEYTGESLSHKTSACSMVDRGLAFHKAICIF
jgi:hypothetical protein